MKKTIEEFKKFATKGNVVDLAVAVVIGGAFGKIVSSLVSDIIMPIIGAILGGVNFSYLSWKINEQAIIAYGSFIQTVIDFLIIAWAIFLVIKLMNKMKKKEEVLSEPSKLSREVELLTEIRDSLKKD